MSGTGHHRRCCCTEECVCPTSLEITLVGIVPCAACIDGDISFSGAGSVSGTWTVPQVQVEIAPCRYALTTAYTGVVARFSHHTPVDEGTCIVGEIICQTTHINILVIKDHSGPQVGRWRINVFLNDQDVCVDDFGLGMEGWIYDSGYFDMDDCNDEMELPNVLNTVDGEPCETDLGDHIGIGSDDVIMYDGSATVTI